MDTVRHCNGNSVNGRLETWMGRRAKKHLKNSSTKSKGVLEPGTPFLAF
jgi:hypothetical protein